MCRYYWYSALNATKKQMDLYASSVVNTWVPVTNTPVALGPVQLIARRPSALTRADMRCEGNGCLNGMATNGAGREYLRVSEIDEYVKAYPERVRSYRFEMVV